MRILFAADVPPDPNTGAPGTTYQTAQACRAFGHEVDAIWAGQLPHRVRHGNSHRLLELPRAYRDAIRQRCQVQPYDVYHVSQPYCYLAAADHRRSGRPGVFVHRSHGLELRVNEVLDSWRQRWRQPQKRWPSSLASALLRRLLDRHSYRAARYCHGTIVSCSECAAFLIERLRVPPQRVAVIPLAAPQSYREQPAVEPHPDQRLRVLYVGQFQFYKAPRVLAEAFRILGARFPQASFTWVCDQCHHEAARRLLGPLAGRCQMLPWMSQECLREVYDRHGIFLFPSLVEGFGKAFLEAMTRGLCVVASNTGGMRDVIRHEKTGFLTPVGDAEALAEGASRVMQDAATFERVARAARRAALAYSWERVVRQTTGFCERLASLERTVPCTTALGPHTAPAPSPPAGLCPAGESP